MPEFNSRQAALIASGQKVQSNSDGTGRTLTIITPATAAWAANDTIASGLMIPKGSRLKLGSLVSTAAMGAGITLSVGIRNFRTKAAITGAGGAAGIASAVSVASAGVFQLNNGSLCAAGVDYIVPEDAEVYATLAGGTPTANAQARIDIEYVPYGC
jgi:hypothetical protein